jgi:hypothetical protein
VPDQCAGFIRAVRGHLLAVSALSGVVDSNAGVASGSDTVSLRVVTTCHSPRTRCHGGGDNVSLPPVTTWPLYYMHLYYMQGSRDPYYIILALRGDDDVACFASLRRAQGNVLRTPTAATETLLTQGSSSAEATPPWPNAEALHWDICSARRQTPSRWPPAAARPAARRARAGTLRMLRRTCPATNTGRTSYANPTRRPEPLPPVSDMHALPTCPWRTGHLTATLSVHSHRKGLRAFWTTPT